MWAEWRNVIFRNPPGFGYKLASLGLLGEMSGLDPAQECIIGITDEA